MSKWKLLRENRDVAKLVAEQQDNYEALSELLAGYWSCAGCRGQNWRELVDCRTCGRARLDGSRRNAGAGQARMSNTRMAHMVDSLPTGGFQPIVHRPPGRMVARTHQEGRLAAAAARRVWLPVEPTKEPGTAHGVAAKRLVANQRKSRCAMCRFGGLEAAQNNLPASTHTCRQNLLHGGEDWTAFSEAHLIPGSGHAPGCACEMCRPHKHEPRADALENLRRSLQRDLPMQMVPRSALLQKKKKGGEENAEAEKVDLWDPGTTYGRAVKQLHSLSRWSYYDELGAPSHEHRTVR